MIEMDQFRRTYVTECYELLTDMEERLLVLSPESCNTEQLNAIFRCAHSIKGGAGAFGLDSITRFTHVLETLLDALREGKVAATREVVDALLKSVDIVLEMVRAAERGEQPPEGLGQEVLGILQRAVANTPIRTASAPAPEIHEGKEERYLIDFSPHENLFCTGNEPLLLIRELKRLGALDVTPYIQRIPPLAEMNPLQCYLGWTLSLRTDKPEAAIREVFEFVEDCCDLKITLMPEQLPQQSAVQDAGARNLKLVAAPVEDAAARQQGSAGSIRVDLEKIDRLVNMVGEMVITESMLRAQARGMDLNQSMEIFRGMDELSQHTRELQEAVMAVRMQPVKSIFSRMPRIVRDLSAQLGKNVKLEIYGEQTEVDKTVIEQLGDPLTHMIRNSVDHGIEKPEVRVKAGKPEQGTVRLKAYHRGGRILIEIHDDGVGIDRARVLKKAREKQLVASDAQLSDEECDNLIFLPGFSTAEVVSSVSGRGVGMDVVKRNIEAINGTVKVVTAPGKGSLFTVSLPLTLAILDGMIVRVGAEHYVIPITSIIESIRPRAQDVKRVEGHRDVINVRGNFIPIVYLNRIFNVSGAVTEPGKALVVLVESGEEKLGLVVDELIGQQQVVIKSLEENTDPVPCISGATILGDGRVSLILELNDLARHCEGESTSPQQARAA